MKVELLGETRQMRARAFLLPRESMVHKLMPADYGELFWSAFSDEKKGPNGKPDMFWDSDARQMSQSFWTVPTNWECLRCDLSIDTFRAKNVDKDSFKINLGDTNNDKHRMSAEFMVNDQFNWVKKRIPVLTPVEKDNEHQLGF